MTSPRHAEASAQGRYYVRPGSGDRLVSVTNVLSVGCAKPALVPWAAKIAAEYALDHLPQIVVQSRTDRDGAIRSIKGEVTVSRDKAADLGTRIHALAEAHLTGRPTAPDEEAAPYIKQYEAFLADYQVDLERDVEAAELTVAYPAQGYAGTLDLLIRLPLDGFIEGTVKRLPGDERALFLVDLKTSATRPAASVYGEYALQLTALRNAVECWLPTDEIVPMPRGIVGCAVLNLRQNTYELVPLPSGDAERAAWNGCLALTKWMHSTGNAIGKGEYRPIDPSGKFKAKATRARKTTTATPGKAA
jgi:hypothetical protein